MSKTEKHEPATEKPVARKSSGGLIRLVAVALFIFLIVTGECLAAYFLLPSASELAAAAEARLGEQAKQAEKPVEEEIVEPEEQPTSEIELGTFNVSSHQAATNSTLRVDFKLAATVATAEKALFDDLYEKHKNRVRDRIIFEIRSTSVSDLSDPGLGLLKRRILERVNTLLGKPVLRGVVVSDFSFVGA